MTKMIVYQRVSRMSTERENKLPEVTSEMRLPRKDVRLRIRSAYTASKKMKKKLWFVEEMAE